MIHPNMATMIGVVTTDAEIPAERLQMHLKKAVDGTFNRVSVDEDTSTNDAVFALASGRQDRRRTTRTGRALREVCLDLARMIVADGEGASRPGGRVVGAATPDGREVAATIGSSLLVRTAVAGGDANWGGSSRRSAGRQPRSNRTVSGAGRRRRSVPRRGATHEVADAAFRSEAVCIPSISRPEIAGIDI